MRFIINVIAALILVMSAASYSDNNFSMRYDARLDTLSFIAKDHSLLVVLNHIADKSGIEIHAAPAIEHLVSGSFQNLSVEATIDQLTRTLNLNVIKSYQSAGEGSDILIGANFLGRGDESALLVPPLRDVEVDVMRYGALPQRYRNQLDDSRSLRDVRWEARIKALPKNVQARYEQLRDEKNARADARELKRLERKADRDEKRKLRAQKREQQIAPDRSHFPKGIPPVLRDAE